MKIINYHLLLKKSLVLIILLGLCLLSPSSLLATTTYWVDASRISNGNGSEANPWKNWSDIDWGSVDIATSTDNVIIYFSSRDTWFSAGTFEVGSSGSSNYTLYLKGADKFNLTDSGVASWQTESVTSNRAKLTQSGGSGIKIASGKSYIEINGFWIYHPVYGGINLGVNNPTTNINHITIDNCFIDTPANNHGVWFGYAETGCSNITVKNNIIHNTPLEAIYMGHATYLDSTITGIIIENNTIIDCGLGGEGDIDIKPGCYGAVIRNNKNYRTEGQINGKDCGVVIGADNCQIYGNEFFNMDEESSDWGFGIFLNADGDGSTGKAITSCLIYNNLIYNNARTGILVTATKNGYALSGVKILNNTITGNGTSGVQITASNTTITIDEFQNNIIYNNANYEMLVTSGVTLSVCDYNLYYRATGNPFSYQGVEKTWEQWQALGFDANGINTDPDLDGSYRPQQSSPYIIRSFGTDLSGIFTVDKDLVIRNPWGIGAYQYKPQPPYRFRVIN